MNNTISKDTIIRTIILIVALINQTLTMFGKNPLPFSDEMIYEVFTILWTIGAAAWAWWKNNSFTAAALEADEYLKELKMFPEDSDE
jgi:SPP1 family holin